MNAITRLSALVVTLAASSAVVAQEASYAPPQPVASSISRAAVVGALEQARQDGTLRLTEADLNRHDLVLAARSRADVRAEALAARASGELDVRDGEGHGFDGQVAPMRPSLRVAAATR